FLYATADGSRVFFTSEARLTASAARNDLYVCAVVEVEVAGHGELTCDLSDLTANAGGSAEVQGAIVPASDEGSYVYFVADGVLTESPNAAGKVAGPGLCGRNPPQGATCNLYVRHYETETRTWEAPVFIAALSSEDSRDWAA